MPIKKVDDLKDSGMKKAGQSWQELLGVNDLTTKEWSACSEYAIEGDGHDADEVREFLHKMRKKNKKK